MPRCKCLATKNRKIILQNKALSSMLSTIRKRFSPYPSAINTLAVPPMRSWLSYRSFTKRAMASGVCADRHGHRSGKYVAGNRFSGTGRGVWLGICPQRERMDAVAKILDLPNNVEAFSLFALGYPAEQRSQEDRFEENRIHFVERLMII